MPSNLKDNVVFASPKTFDERSQMGQTCVRKLGVKFPAVVDRFDDATERAYTGWPDRLYVIDRNGRIAYKSKPGPFGFSPDGVADTLARLVPQPAPKTKLTATCQAPNPECPPIHAQ